MEPLQPHQSRWYRRTDPQGRALLALLLPLAGVYLCQLVTLQEPAAAWAWMGSHAGAAGYTYRLQAQYTYCNRHKGENSNLLQAQLQVRF